MIGIICASKSPSLNESIDAATHAVYSGDQINGLERWYCSADGILIGEEKIDELRTLVEQLAIGIYTSAKQLGFEARKELYWRQKAWGYKDLFVCLSMDWEPPREAALQARGQAVFGGWKYPTGRKVFASFLRDVFDPRQEISGKWIG